MNHSMNNFIHHPTRWMHHHRVGLWALLAFLLCAAAIYQASRPRLYIWSPFMASQEETQKEVSPPFPRLAL